MSGPHDRLVRFTFDHPEGGGGGATRRATGFHRLPGGLGEPEAGAGLGGGPGAEEVSAVFHYLLLVGGEGAKGITVDMLKSVVGAKRTEELMSDWFETQFVSARQKSKAEGRAEDVLRILTVRGVRVDDAARQRILSCTDLDTLGAGSIEP